MSYYVSCQSLLDAVGKEYQLVDCKRSASLGNWGEHIRWILQDSSSDRFFLKERPFYLDPFEYNLHLLLHRHVLQNSGPVVPLLYPLSGNLHFTWCSRQFELQKWIKGRHVQQNNLADVAILGRLIGEFQAHASNFYAVEYANWSTPKMRSEFCPERGDEIIACIGLIRQVSRSAGSKIQDWLNTAKETLDIAELPEQFIHGDTGYYNIVIDNKGNSFLVDLDNVHWGHRIADIAHTLAHVGAMDIPQEGGNGSSILTNWRWDKIKIALNGFESYIELDEVERECLFIYMGVRLIELLISCLNLNGFASYAPPNNLMDQIDLLLVLLEDLNQYL